MPRRVYLRPSAVGMSPARVADSTRRNLRIDGFSLRPLRLCGEKVFGATGESPAPFAVRPYSPVTGHWPVCVYPRASAVPLFYVSFFLIRAIRVIRGYQNAC